MVVNGASGAVLGPPPTSDGLAALLSASSSASSSASTSASLPHATPTATNAESNSTSSSNAKTASSSTAPSSSSKPAGIVSTSSASSSSSTPRPLPSRYLSPSHPVNLRKLARTGLESSFSVKSYIGAASALLEKAKSDDAQGLAEQAFVNYLKSANVASSITKHAEWPKTLQQRNPPYYRYQDFMKNVPDIISRTNRLEELLLAREEARAEEAREAMEAALKSEEGQGGEQTGNKTQLQQLQNQTTQGSPLQSLSQGQAPREEGDEEDDARRGGGTDAAEVFGFSAAAASALQSSSPPASPVPSSRHGAATPTLSNGGLLSTADGTQTPGTLQDRLSALRLSGMPSPSSSSSGLSNEGGGRIPNTTSAIGGNSGSSSNVVASIARRASLSTQTQHAIPYGVGSLEEDGRLPPPPESPHRAPPPLPTGLDEEGSDWQKRGTYPALDEFEAALVGESGPASFSDGDGLDSVPHGGIDNGNSVLGTSSLRPLPTPPVPLSSASTSASASASHSAAANGRQNFNLAQRTLVSVEELFTLLNPGFDTVADSQGNQRMVRKPTSRVLVADARPRSEFRAMRIKGPDAFCLDSSNLVAGMSAQAIRHALGSEAEVAAFDARDTYDLVVVLDRDSRGYLGPGIGSSPSQSHPQQQQTDADVHLELLYRALTANARTPVALLVGGIDRWARKVGEMGLVGDSVAQHQPQRSAPQDEEVKRARRQGIYVPDEGPSMPAPAYQSTSAQGYAMPAPLPRSLRPGEVMPRSMVPAATSSKSTSSMASFDYPQLRAGVGGPAPPPPAMNGTSSRGSTSSASVATAISAPSATAATSARGNSMELARRPLVPPPGGAPISHAPRMASYTTPNARQIPRTDIHIGLTGLKNVGNSCYMNSTLQCLSATIPLAKFLLEGSYKKAINHVNPLGTKGALAEAFAQLVRVMWSEQYTFVAPVTFREAITRFAPAFRGYDQHDAQEFLAFLLDGLHEDLNYVKQKPPPVEMTPARELELETLPQQVASVKEWAIYRARNDSLIVDWFQGQFRNKLTCLTCSKTSTTYNAFMYLSLPIPAATARGQSVKVSLTQCLDAFTRDEILDKADAWHCPRCKKPRKASKRLSISRLPQVLLIHLKRFSFKGPFTDKITTHVTVPTTNLDLTNYMPPPLPPGAMPKGAPVSASQQPPYVYDLYACVHHFGSLTGGHYTSTVRTQTEKGPEWMYCDDSRVMKSDDRQINSPSPYLLFYFRRGR